jgi:hypothetical protein
MHMGQYEFRYSFKIYFKINFQSFLTAQNRSQSISISEPLCVLRASVFQTILKHRGTENTQERSNFLDYL